MAEINDKKYEEMDIFVLIETLWKSKLTIFGFLFLGFILTASYAFINSRDISYSGEVKLTSLNALDLSSLQILEYNLRKLDKIDVFISQDFYDKPIIITSTLADTTETVLATESKEIFDLFYQKLFSFDVALKTVKELYKNEDSNEEGYLKKQASLLSSSIKKTVRSIDKLDMGNFYVIVSYTNSDPELIKKSMNLLITESINEVQKQLLQTLNLSMKNYERRINFEIERLKQDNLLLLDTYKTKLGDELIFLKEQAQIARSIDIDKPRTPQIQQTTQNIQTAGTGRVSPGSLMPEYYQGYIVLENKIRILENRKNHEAFIPQYRQNEVAMEKLANDTKIESLKRSINETGLSNMTFTPVKYEYDSITISKNQPKYLYLNLAGLIIGFFLGSFIVIFKEFYQRDKSKKIT